jgi:predicted methyltransferase MtxX (methanogen marker protein 4)
MKNVKYDTPDNEIFIDEITKNQIVIAVDKITGKIRFKLHRVASDPAYFAFIAIDDSNRWSCGSYSSVKKAILAASQYHQIVVLDDIVELGLYL